MILFYLKLQIDENSAVQIKVKRSLGTQGRKIPIETNHLPLVLDNLQKIKSAVHYDVEIDPDRPKKMLRSVVEKFRKIHFKDRYPAFDGVKNLYSATKLPIPNDIISNEVEVEEDDGRMKKFTVTIKFANYIDLSIINTYLNCVDENILKRLNIHEAIQCVDIVLRSAPAQNFIPVGRSYFSSSPGIVKLGEGMGMYVGFYLSSILGWKPYLNVDVAHKAFPLNISVEELFYELFKKGMNQYEDRDKRALEKHLRSLKIDYCLPGHSGSKRKFTVNGLETCAARAEFIKDDKSRTTVDRYYQTDKHYRIKYPNFPTLWVGSKNKKILVPAELCTIVKDQVVNRKMTENQTRNMIRYAATNTDVRKDNIKHAITEAEFNKSPAVNEFGIKVVERFLQLDGRVLDPPDLEYLNNAIARPKKGVWRSNRFLHGASINKWTILNLDKYTRTNQLEKFESRVSMQIHRLPVNLKIS